MLTSDATNVHEQAAKTLLFLPTAARKAEACASPPLSLGEQEAHSPSRGSRKKQTIASAALRSLANSPPPPPHRPPHPPNARETPLHE